MTRWPLPWSAYPLLHQVWGLNRDIHLGFVRGLPGPYAVTRAAMDRQIRQGYPGAPLSRDEYHAAAEATLDPCPCGGRFRYDAPARCPSCRATSEMWDLDPKAPQMFYD